MEKQDIVEMAEDTCTLVRAAADLPIPVRAVLLSLAAVICAVAKALSDLQKPSASKGD